MPTRPELHAPDVVVVEDDPSIRDLISMRLGLAGYFVHGACDGVEGVAMIEAVRPRAILLDINMPRLDGFGVLTRLRADPALRAIPVLMLTARNAGEDVQRAIALGARDYLTKPFDQRVLLQRVDRLMRRRRTTAAEDVLMLD